MNISESLREWVRFNQPDFEAIEDIPVHIQGEVGDLYPPLLAIFETDSTDFTQDDTVMYGVTQYEITVELQTVPADDGTAPEAEQKMRTDFYDILGDRAAIDWISQRNYWRVFDIRLPGPKTEAADGRRITRWILTVIACPI